jgi:hypothetical protein
MSELTSRTLNTYLRAASEVLMSPKSHQSSAHLMEVAVGVEPRDCWSDTRREHLGMAAGKLDTGLEWYSIQAEHHRRERLGSG